MKMVCILLGLLLARELCFAQMPEMTTQPTRAYNALGFKILDQLRKTGGKPDIFISPLSLALALSILENGAGGATEREIATLLGNADNFNEANQTLVQSLANIDPKVTLEIANSLWIADNLPAKREFIAAGRKFYDAEVANVDFNSPRTADVINSWVDKRTRGKISKMVEPPLDDERMIILDAVYFKGLWTRPFDKKLTGNKPFTLENGQTIAHPRMAQSGRFGYFESDVFQAVKLPYADGKVNMRLFLPKHDLKTFIASLDASNWESWSRQFRPAEGRVEMPRLKLNNEYLLNDSLQALGMRLAFSREADLKGIASGPLYVGWVKQKTFVEVNEAGTEAAAVTGIGVRSLAVHRPTAPFQMIVDRPFFFAICEEKTGAILFEGAIGDPR